MCHKMVQIMLNHLNVENNRGIGEIRFSDFRGKSQIYKTSDFAEGDNHGYNQYGYYGYGNKQLG